MGERGGGGKKEGEGGMGWEGGALLQNTSPPHEVEVMGCNLNITIIKLVLCQHRGL